MLYQRKKNYKREKKGIYKGYVKEEKMIKKRLFDRKKCKVVSKIRK